MSFRIRDIVKLYYKLGGNVGFKVELREGRDTLAKIFCDGKLILFTKVPHGKGALDGRLIYYIRNQFKLGEADFRDFVRCTLSAEDYKKILKTKGFLE